MSDDEIEHGDDVDVGVDTLEDGDPEPGSRRDDFAFCYEVLVDHEAELGWELAETSR